MVDDRGDLTDLGLPAEGTEGHLTLLLAEYLAACARTQPGAQVSRAALHQRVAELIAEHRHHWRKGVTEPGADQVLADDTITRLAAVQLVRLELDSVVPLPAIARYALDEVREAEQPLPFSRI
jgi:uncharacterized protein (TIGR02678 family)